MTITDGALDHLVMVLRDCVEVIREYREISEELPSGRRILEPAGVSGALAGSVQRAAERAAAVLRCKDCTLLTEQDISR